VFSFVDKVTNLFLEMNAKLTRHELNDAKRRGISDSLTLPQWNV
jgi:hypothetical protein